LSLKDNIFKIALLLGAIFLFKTAVFSQNDMLELLPGSEKFIYNEKTGVHRLIGTVNFKYQGNTMYCDSAHYHEFNKNVYAYGNVHVVKGDVNLFCDSLYYNGNAKKAKLWSNVRVRDNEYKLLTDTLDYETQNSVGIYRYGGRIERIQEKEILTSKIGYIYTKSKNMFFSQNVSFQSAKLKVKTDTLQFKYDQSKALFFGPTFISTYNDSLQLESEIYTEKGWFNTETEEATLEKNASIKNKETFISGNYIYSFPDKGLSKGKGNIYFKDSIQNLIFSGEDFYSNDSTNVFYLTDKALVRSINKTDTLYIHADSLFAFKDSLKEFERVKGYYNVKFFKADIQGVCDSLSYNKAQGKMELFKKPIVWAQSKAELKGDFINVFFEGDSILRNMNVLGNSTVLLEVDSGQYYNQIGGKNINAFFVNNELVRTDVKGNACTVYFPENKDSETDTTITIKRLGMNRIYASDLRVYLDSNEVKGVTYFEKPDGVFYPIEKLNKEEQFIKGFDWKIALRPKSWKELIE
jgi:DNA-dependent RNA polymerase auxiliary subunit epsilon